MVIRFRCFQDYYSRLCPPETIKFVGMRRQSWLSAFVVFKTIPVFFAFQRQSSLLACGDNHGHPFSLFSRLFQSSLPSKDNQVCWHVETINVFRSLSFQRPFESFVETSMSPLLCKTSRPFVDIPDASYALSVDRFH